MSVRISISKLKCFKACRRKYELKYIEKLEPVQKSEALETGSNYHGLLEYLNNNGSLHGADAVENSKELAMANAYWKYIYPKFKVVEAEKWLEKEFGDDKLVGIVDGIAEDGHIVEHKTYGGNDSMEQYEYNLQWDEQILAYMLLTGSRKVWYTVCRKPTIKQKKNETEEEFFDRMVAWYDEDTDNKIRLFEIERTDEEVEQFEKNLLSMIVEINVAENHKKNSSAVVTDPFYRNTCHCEMWGRRCEYSSVCLNYDPNQEYIEFTKGERNGT